MALRICLTLALIAGITGLAVAEDGNDSYVLLKWCYSATNGQPLFPGSGPGALLKVISVKNNQLEVQFFESRAIVKRDEVVTIDEAVPFFSAGLKQNPGDSWCRIGRAVAYRRRKEFDKAIADYDVLLGQGQQNGVRCEYLWDRGSLWQAKGRYDMAIKDFDAIIALQSNEACGHGYESRGEAKRLMGNYEQALADFEKALELNPDSWSPHRSMAVIYSSCPDKKFIDIEKALTHSQIACGLSQYQDGDCLALVATIFASQGDFQNAQRWQTAAFGAYQGADKVVARKVLEEYGSKLR